MQVVLPISVSLDPDHPGFSDSQYRQRRNSIAQSAIEHKTRSPIPIIDYTKEENHVWALVWRHLKEVHQKICLFGNSTTARYCFLTV